MDCGESKPLSDFYRNGDRYRPRCKKCHNKRVGAGVMDWRRRKKQQLIELHGGRCVDCGLTGPPFLFDFDHRDPEEKSFGLSTKGQCRSWDKIVAESEKCDLVCANCHRWRTHRQRCSGCEHCVEAAAA